MIINLVIKLHDEGYLKEHRDGHARRPQAEILQIEEDVEMTENDQTRVGGIIAQTGISNSEM